MTLCFHFFLAFKGLVEFIRNNLVSNQVLELESSNSYLANENGY